MIPVNTLITKLNDIISAGGLTELELAQVFGAIDSLENNGVSSVASVSELPSAADNKGRFLYIENEYRYVFSNGVSWSMSNVLKPIDVNLYAWGLLNGNNTALSSTSPVSVAGEFTDWIQVGVGPSHSLAIRANGTAWAWGYGFYGKLGNGATTSRLSPTAVVGGFADWTQISAGFDHSLGVRANGTAWGWGVNTNGRLGDGTITSRLSPVSVVGGFTDWVQVSAGSKHSLGVRANGTAWGWGYNNGGQLGNGTTTGTSSPVSVVGGFTDWVQVSADAWHSLGVRANGTAWGWGENAYGQLGNDTTTSASSPVSVVGGFTDWTQISNGSFHSIALRENGTVWAWGSNSIGQLGDGTTTSRSSPVSVIGGFTDWTQISAAGNGGLALRANGTAWAWGSGLAIGYGDTVNRSSPVSVVGGFTNWVQIDTASNRSGGIRS